MQEVEVKAKLINRDQAIARLKHLGVDIFDTLTQDDRVFLHKDLDLQNLPSDRLILRIRKQNDAVIFTLKQHGKNELDNYEREITTDNATALQEILEKLGYVYYPQLSVKKVRTKAKYNDLEICLDEVEHLGSFIEVEKLTDSHTDSEQIQSELFVFLEELGVNKSEQVTQGYDTLMRLYWEATKA